MRGSYTRHIARQVFNEFAKREAALAAEAQELRVARITNKAEPSMRNGCENCGGMHWTKNCDLPKREDI